MADSISSVLPCFKSPPVVETVIGIHFRSLDKLSSAHQGILWERCFRSDFPVLQDRPPLDEVRERFGEELLAPPTIRWRISDRPDIPRLWAVSESGEHVVQIQRNAFFTNWLKSKDLAPYRFYVERKQDFCKKLELVENFLRDDNLGIIEPTSWVITYINHIEYGGLKQIGSEVHRIISSWSNQTSDDWLPQSDKLALEYAFPMPDNVGRLNVHLKPIIQRHDQKQMLRFELSARGSVQESTVKDALKWIDLGHEWVVRGFTSLTTPEMHIIWERNQ
jgi:uncharacterized protein (TIGR04255 family)